MNFANIQKGKFETRTNAISGHKGPIICKELSRDGVQADPWKLHAYRNAHPPNIKDLQSFLDLMNYLSKYCPSSVEVCEPLRRLTSLKTELTCNLIHNELHNKVEAVIKQDIFMKLQ